MEMKQGVDCFDVSVNCCRTRVVVQHELFNKACDNSLVPSLRSTRVGNVFILTELYIDSLPKSCGFKLRIRFKSGHFCVNNISQINESSL